MPTPLTVTFFGRPFASGNFTQIGPANTGVAVGDEHDEGVGEPGRRPGVSSGT